MANRYRYIVTPNKVVVLSKYAGKDVRGIAKCNPNDEFNEDVGTNLARLRCDEKVAYKRFQRAQRKLAQALEEVEAANRFYVEMKDYYNRSVEEYDEATNCLNDYYRSLY